MLKTFVKSPTVRLATFLIAASIGASAVLVPSINMFIRPDLTWFVFQLGLVVTIIIAPPFCIYAAHQYGRAVRINQELRERTEELRQAKESAEAGSHAKTRFLAIMSHEIRTPLNGVLGTAQLLARADLPDQQKVLVDALLDSGESLLTLLNDVLELSRVESSNLQIVPVEANPAAELQRVVKLYKPLALEKGLRLELEVDPSVPRSAVFDPQRLHQCIGNLVSNAIKFTSSGFVRIEARFKYTQILEIDVIDTGIGISEAEQDMIFDAFSQANVEIEKRYGGSGLGLSICKMLAEKMGGFVGLASEPGMGSTFTVFCPLGTIKSPPADAADPTPLTDDMLSDVEILIADDTETNRTVLRLFLERAGAHVIETCNGTEALEALSRLTPDLVLIDGHMPHASGFDVVGDIRQRHGAGLPVLLMTATPHDFDRDDVQDAGFSGIVAKPFSERCLIAEILRTLPRSAAA